MLRISSVEGSAVRGLKCFQLSVHQGFGVFRVCVGEGHTRVGEDSPVAGRGIGLGTHMRNGVP